MRQIYSIAIDGDGVVHQFCKIESRVEAVIILKQLGAAITKISDDLIKDVERKGK
jgi:hypothetical protein